MTFELTNSQRMALCTFLREYIMAASSKYSTLPEQSIDCSEGPEVVTTPADLLNIFMGV